MGSVRGASPLDECLPSRERLNGCNVGLARVEDEVKGFDHEGLKEQGRRKSSSPGSLTTRDRLRGQGEKKGQTQRESEGFWPNFKRGVSGRAHGLTRKTIDKGGYDFNGKKDKNKLKGGRQRPTLLGVG